MHNKIVVMGDRNSVLGFRALGLDARVCEERAVAFKLLRELTGAGCPIIYITEDLALELEVELARLRGVSETALIVIPGGSGPKGLGMTALRDAVERAVGAAILD